MQIEWVVKYVGGGVLVIIGYILISNIIWLLMGARAIQFLPGVNDKTALGTIKLAIILLFSLVGIFCYLIRLPLSALGIIKYKPFRIMISSSIQSGSRLLQHINKFINIRRNNNLKL